MNKIKENFPSKKSLDKEKSSYEQINEYVNQIIEDYNIIYQIPNPYYNMENKEKSVPEEEYCSIENLNIIPLVPKSISSLFILYEKLDDKEISPEEFICSLLPGEDEDKDKDTLFNASFENQSSELVNIKFYINQLSVFHSKEFKRFSIAMRNHGQNCDFLGFNKDTFINSLVESINYEKLKEFQDTKPTRLEISQNGFFGEYILSRILNPFHNNNNNQHQNVMKDHLSKEQKLYVLSCLLFCFSKTLIPSKEAYLFIPLSLNESKTQWVLLRQFSRIDSPFWEIYDLLIPTANNNGVNNYFTALSNNEIIRHIKVKLDKS